jgi:hypothetical protein
MADGGDLADDWLTTPPPPSSSSSGGNWGCGTGSNTTVTGSGTIAAVDTSLIEDQLDVGLHMSSMS